MSSPAGFCIFTVQVESMESRLEDVYLNFIPLPFFGWILILFFLSLCYINLYSMRSVPLPISFPGQYLDAAVIAHETWHKPKEPYENQKTNLCGSSLGFGLIKPVVPQNFLSQLPQSLTFFSSPTSLLLFPSCYSVSQLLGYSTFLFLSSLCSNAFHLS